MKVLVFTDNHWSSTSSIIRSLGDKYSTRLENQIKCLNWIEELAIKENCDEVYCLGDFFDRSELNAMELTALKDVKWNNLPHKMLVGNHELGINNLTYSSAHLFDSLNMVTIDKPISYDYPSVEVCFLPYVLETNRKKIIDYFKEKPSNKKRIIFSHNDLKGIQMGPYFTQTGFDIEDIENNCNMFVNGHLHNGYYVTPKILNLGNLTGQNFGEDAFEYVHNIAIIDLDSSSIQLIENPYAFNFYKLNLITTKNIDKVLSHLKSNAIVTVKCYSSDVNKFREAILNSDKVIVSRFIIEKEFNVEKEIKADLSVDHLEKFKNYIIETLGTSEAVLAELSEVIK